MTRTVLTSATEIDWTSAKEAALRIIKRCDDAGFTAPEALDVIRGNIQAVCMELDAIVRALKITPPATSPGHVCPVPYGLGPEALVEFEAARNFVARYGGFPETIAALDKILAAHRVPEPKEGERR